MTFVFSHRPPQDRPPVCIGVPIDYEHCLHDIHVLAFSIDFEIRLQYGIVQEDFRTISIFRHKYQFRGSPGSRQCLRSCRYLKIPMLWANSTENFRTFWPPSSSLFLIGPVVGLYYLKWYYELFTCIAWDPIYFDPFFLLPFFFPFFLFFKILVRIDQKRMGISYSQKEYDSYQVYSTSEHVHY